MQYKKIIRTCKMNWDKVSYELLLIFGIFIGVSISICLCVCQRLRCRNIKERPFEDNVKVLDIEALLIKDPEEGHFTSAMCACKPGDFPHCLLEP